MATKKVGTSGRFGPRYGGVMRKAVATIEKSQKAAHACARCGSMSVYRDGTAIWSCVKCGYSFAGGAWNGTGITSASAAAEPNRAIGYGEASAIFGISGTQTANFLGQTVDASSLLLATM